MKTQQGTTMKLVSEVNRRKVELIVYSAYLMGFSASNEQRNVDHPDNFKEIKALIAQIY